MWAQIPSGAWLDQPAYASANWKLGTLESSAEYNVQHDNGAGSKTTTNVTGIDLTLSQKGIQLGATFKFLADTDYYIEMVSNPSGGSNGDYLLAAGMFIQNLTLAHNDGSQFVDQWLFGGIGGQNNIGSEVGDYSPNGTNTSINTMGDGLILKYEANTVVQASGKIGNFPNHDTDPGQLEATYVGSWSNTTAAPTHYSDSTLPDLSLDSPHYCHLGWIGEQHSIQWFGHKTIDQAAGAKTATYVFTARIGGVYKVYEWHGWVGKDASASTEVDTLPFTGSRLRSRR